MTRLLLTYSVLTLLALMRPLSAEGGEEHELAFDDSAVIFNDQKIWPSEKKPFWFLLPDLTVSIFPTPVPVPNPSGKTYTVTVTNIGKRYAGASVLMLWNVGAHQSQTRQVASLAVGQSQSFNFLVPYPEDQGPFHLSAIADYGNKVRERVESNNTRTLYQY